MQRVARVAGCVVAGGAESADQRDTTRPRSTHLRWIGAFLHHNQTRGREICLAFWVSMHMLDKKDVELRIGYSTSIQAPNDCDHSKMGPVNRTRNRQCTSEIWICSSRHSSPGQLCEDHRCSDEWIENQKPIFYCNNGTKMLLLCRQLRAKSCFWSFK